MTREVRQATDDDALAVHRTARASWHAAYGEILESETIDAVVDDWYAIGDLGSSIADASERDDVAFLVAAPPDARAVGELEHECRGFAHVVPWPEDPAVGYLASLYVDPDVWREGIGTALLETVETRLEDSFDGVRLAVLAANDVGVSFAKSAGFEHVATRETGLTEGLEEYVYEKAI